MPEDVIISIVLYGRWKSMYDEMWKIHQKTKSLSPLIEKVERELTAITDEILDKCDKDDALEAFHQGDLLAEKYLGERNERIENVCTMLDILSCGDNATNFGRKFGPVFGHMSKLNRDRLIKMVENMFPQYKDKLKTILVFY